MVSDPSAPSPLQPDAALARLAPALAQALAEAGIATRTREHAPVFTVEESQALRGEIAGAHTKNLFVKDKKGRHFLVVVEEGASIDLKTLHARIGASGRLSFSDGERMGRMLGVEPGAVTVFGALNDRAGEVAVVLDEALLRHDILNAHPLTNRATTSIAVPSLLAFLGRTGHEPQIISFSDGPTTNGATS